MHDHRVFTDSWNQTFPLPGYSDEDSKARMSYDICGEFSASFFSIGKSSKEPRISGYFRVQITKGAR